MPMPTVDPATAPIAEPSAFETAVRERSWAWLLELQRRLGTEAQIVDAAGGAVLLPRATLPSAGSLASLLESPDAALEGALSEALHDRAPRVAVVDGLEVACVALVHDGRAAGALVLGRPARGGRADALAVGSIDALTSWLSIAVGAHLTEPPGLRARGLDRVSPLCRLLSREAHGGSDSALIRRFAEAMAIWYDVNVTGYVETENGTFLREVVLPGNAGDRSPAWIGAEGVPEGSELAPLPQAQADRFTSAGTGDALVARLRAGKGPSWLVLFAGRADDYLIQRLAAAVAILRLSLQAAVSAAAVRVAAAVSRSLAGRGLEAGARLALDELRTAVGAAAASMLVESFDGGPVVRADSPAAGGAPEPREAARLVVERQAEGNLRTRLVLTRTDGRPFTPAHHRMAAVAAELLGSDADRGEPGASRERRRRARRFDEEIERCALQALGEGTPVTAIVVAPTPDARDVDLRAWMRAVRGWTRATDLVGPLAAGGLGILLRDAPPEHAAGVAGRLRNLMDTAGGKGSVAVGVASRPPGAPAAGIIDDARRAILLTARGKSPARDF
jgi:hypothetical protein